MYINNHSVHRAGLKIVFITLYSVLFLFNSPAYSQNLPEKEVSTNKEQSSYSSEKAQKEQGQIERPTIEYAADNFRDPFEPQIDHLKLKEESKEIEKIEVKEGMGQVYV